MDVLFTKVIALVDHLLQLHYSRSYLDNALRRTEPLVVFLLIGKLVVGGTNVDAFLQQLLVAQQLQRPLILHRLMDRTVLSKDMLYVERRIDIQQFLTLIVENPPSQH